MIIAPAKQMKVDTDTFPCSDLPVFLDRAELLKDHLNSLSFEEQKNSGLAMTRSRLRTTNGSRTWICGIT